MPAHGGVIVVANHESLADPFFLAAAFDRRLRYLTKADLWRYPLVSQFLNSVGCIRIDRGRGDLEAISEASEALASGAALAIFPQGTTVPRRNRPWLRGAARLALTTGASVLPVALVHTESVLRPVRIRIGFPSVRVVIGAPIVPDPVPPTAVAAKALTAQIQHAVDSLRAPDGPPKHLWID